MTDKELAVGDMRGFRYVVDYVNGAVWEPGGLPWLEVLVPEEGPPRVWTGKEWRYV